MCDLFLCLVKGTNQMIELSFFFEKLTHKFLLLFFLFKGFHNNIYFTLLMLNVVFDIKVQY